MWPPRTLAITDRTRLHGGDGALVSFVTAVAEAGVDAVQIRERDWGDRRLWQVTRAACQAVRHTRCRVLVNERAHVAGAAGAHGGHRRARVRPAARLRQVQPIGALIGRSVHAGDDPDVAVGADYVLFGTVFPSASKAPGSPVAGLEALAAWAAREPALPVLAVGGIDPARCVAVQAAGACGIAGIDLFASAYGRGASALADTVRDIHAVFGDEGRAA